MEVSNSGPRTWQEQGICMHANLMGIPHPVYGVYDARTGKYYRVEQSKKHVSEQIRDGVMRWEADDGLIFENIDQQGAVDMFGFHANFVYNPWTNARADMGISTPDGWARMFPDRPDCNPSQGVQPSLFPPAPDKTSWPFSQAPVQPTETAKVTGVSQPPAPATFTSWSINASAPKLSLWGRVKAFFSRLFGG
jgi:hypothetical protein